MDCARVKEVLTDRYSPDLLDAHELDEALAHCETCLDCAMFARALASLDAIPRPVAPDRTVRTALEAVRTEIENDRAASEAAAEDSATPADAAIAGSVDPDDPGAAQTLDEQAPSPIARVLGGQRFGIYAAAAAVFVVAVFGGVQLLTAGMSSTGADDLALESADQPMGSIIDEDAAVERGEEAAAEPQADQSVAAVSAAPPYVVYEGIVHIVGTEASLTFDSEAIGQVTTAKAVEGDIPRLWNVYEDDDGNLFLQGAGFGLYSRLTPITRRYANATYALVSSQPIDAYGDWPGLPTHIPEPSAPDGSPVFVEAGTGPSGTPLYARTGTSLTEGFAVAPGTSTSDPAAGNPNWTWWEPIDG